MRFANPYLLWLLVLLAPMIAYYIYRTLRGGATIRISTVEGVKRAPRTLRYWLRHLPFALRVAAFALLVVVLARPQAIEEQSHTNAEGIDIMLSIDVSGSMLARDFQPDRLEAAKEVAAAFISDRVGDRIGVAVFAGESFTQSPLTTDKSTLQTMLARIRSGVIEDGTAIGNGLATAIARMKDSDAKSRVVILLTDGVNNRGEISPQMAAEIAKTYGVRVYTIGVGKEGMAPYPVMTPWGVEVQNVKVEIDETLLAEIAESTGGRYFRATDNTKLAEIYSEINRMEKARTTIDSFPIYKELFLGFALLALFALLMELVLNWFVIRRLP